MRRPRLLALLAVVLWLAIAGIGGPLVGKLSAIQKNDQASFLPAQAESSLAAQELKAFSSSAALPFFVVITRTDGADLAPSDLVGVGTFAKGLTEREVHGLPATKLSSLLASPPGAVVPSADKKAVLVPISADAAKAGAKLGEGTGTTAVATTIRDAAKADLASAGLRVQVTGPGGFAADLGKAFAGIDGLLLLVALGVVFVILLIVYRSPILPFAVLITAIFGLAAAALVVYPLADAGHIQVSGQSQGILSILVVGAATDYSLLLVARWKEELHQVESGWEAMKAAWRGTLEPIAASGATVILGLLCLLLADLGGTRGLGPISALGIAGALLSALTFLPAVLVALGRKVFWPVIPRVDHVHLEDTRRKGIWAFVAREVTNRPRSVWVGAVVLLAIAAAFTPTFKASGLTQGELFRTTVESVEGQKTLDAHFPAGSGQPAQMVVPQAQAQQVIDVVKSVPGIDAATLTAVSPAPGAPPKVIDGKVVVNAVFEKQADSPQAQEAVSALRAKLAALSPAPKVGGITATTLDTKLASDHDLRVVIPAILVVVFVVLVLLLRSLLAPVLLVLANILSFGATIGISAIVFNHVFGFPNADPATPLYGFVFLIALGIDYSIFLMTRVREETPKRGTRKAVIVALTVTGAVITSAGVVLAATFSALIVLPLVFMAQIAFLVAFGVLLDTFVVRSLLVPGLVYDIGPRVWWPGRPEATAAKEPAPLG